MVSGGRVGRSRAGAQQSATRTRASANGGMLCLGFGVLVAIPVPGTNYLVALHVVVAGGLWVVVFSVVRGDFLLRTLWVLAFVALAAQLIIDLIRDVPPGGAAGFVGGIIMILATAMLWLTRSEGIHSARVVWWFTSGWLVLALATGASDWARNPWKYALALPALYWLLAVAWRRGSRTGTVGLLLTMHAAVSLYFDSRFYAALPAAALFVLLTHGTASLARNRRRFLGAALAATASAYAAYPTLARAGLWGERATAQQSRYDTAGTNFFIDNRAEFFQSLYLARENLWLGVGSGQPVSSVQRVGALDYLASLGVQIDNARAAYLTDAFGTGRGYAPHSGVLDAMIQGGVLVLPFWLFCIWVIMRRTILQRENGAPALALAIIASGSALWNMLFSPLDLNAGFNLALALYLCLASAKHFQTAVKVAERRTPRVEEPPAPRRVVNRIKWREDGVQA